MCYNDSIKVEGGSGKMKRNKLINGAWEMLLIMLFCTLFFLSYFWGINYLVSQINPQVPMWANMPIWMLISAFALSAIVGVILDRAESNPVFHGQDARKILNKKGRY